MLFMIRFSKLSEKFRPDYIVDVNIVSSLASDDFFTNTYAVLKQADI